MLIATLYMTGVQAVRKTADDCRRLTALFDALGAVYETVLVDTAEMRQFVETLTSRTQLPLLCVGEACLGTYDEVMDLVEDGVLPQRLRDVGYSEAIRGGEAIAVKPPPVIQKKLVVKKVVVVKKKTVVDGEQGPSPADDDDVPPPPPEDDIPPPPPEDDIPPPPPEDDIPPPPPEDDDIPPPPPDDDIPPPPPDDDDIPPPPPE
ncbi:Hypothetical protein, putative [Bodo saltans]|uniref:Uncharacterized protein n=1 Tax=Bodo saltans TaxID=75058 RepID=A0A0S4JBL2_BODSA|nr:Hypothetical protein, putative [Bodo saltans]|eukprot:CUG88890.1 Hypothetical protein, putative [Bodo saltans]